MLHDHFEKANDARLAEAKCFVTAWRGGYSGSTYASMVEGWTRLARDPAARTELMNPYGLNSDGHREGPDQHEGLAPRWDPDLGAWAGMFLMAPANTRVVRRSRELLGEAYAEGFSYREEMAFGAGPGGWVRASWEAFRWLTVMVATMATPTRWLVRRLVPSPGQGPGREARERGCFAYEIHAAAEAKGGEVPRAVGRVGAEVDTYGVTGKVASAAATLLATGRDELPDAAGVLTPASALGLPLVDRLRGAGMVFDVEPVTP
jgi:short subunit dehydrogenase-like uncharacterized protein